ncbi:hypothetical protein [Francisella philomiragia]|uniref:hypothetical protein n=1 Tax=Francisella philomiragia TaxID=28110 RepID=UPI0011871BDE|nr:hypothetical protein [Francisella philomiragia]MBK2252738.1 hypothetical protein [Francisella philomiragia]
MSIGIESLITLFISFGSLIISLISLYFSLFYKRISFVGALASWNPRIVSYDDSQVCEIAVSNSGNREFIIREVDIFDSPEEQGDTFPILKIDNVPMVMKPGEIKLLTFPIDDYYLLKLRDRNKRFKLEFHIYTDKAKHMIAIKELSPNIVSEEGTPKSDWEPFKIQNKWFSFF